MSIAEVGIAMFLRQLIGVRLIAGTIGLLLLLVSPGCSDSVDHANFPVVMVSPSKLDVGSIWTGSTASRTLRIRNVTDRDVHIENLMSSCVCLTIDPPSLVLEPGEEADLVLSLLFPPHYNAADPEAFKSRPFEITILPLVEGRESGPPPTWPVRGAVADLFTLSESVVDFGELTVDASSQPIETVTVETHVPLRSLVARADPPLFNISTSQHSDTEYTVSLQPHDSLELGHFRAKVVLDAVSDIGENVAYSNLEIIGEVVGDVRASPTAIRPGMVRVGDTLQASIALRSRSNSPFTIMSVTADSPSINIQITRGPRMGIYILSIEYPVVAHGLHQNFIVVSTANPPTEAPNTITIPVVYYGFSDG